SPAALTVNAGRCPDPHKGYSLKRIPLVKPQETLPPQAALAERKNNKTILYFREAYGSLFGVLRTFFFQKKVLSGSGRSPADS
ncbi:MAG: hypothetical protein ACOX88_10605, partial [Christensenellales bacterium]